MHELRTAVQLVVVYWVCLSLQQLNGKVTTIVASEGDSVAFECNGTMGTNFSLLLTLNDSAATETRYTIPHTTNCTDHCIATFLLLNVTRDDSGTYQCTYDSDVYQLTVNAAHVPVSYCTEDVSYLGPCLPYLQGKGKVLIGPSGPLSPKVLDTYLSTISTLASSPLCTDGLKQLLCLSVYPLCDPSTAGPRPLPICNESCWGAVEGPCALDPRGLGAENMSSVLRSNCGGPLPEAGGLPECVQLQLGPPSHQRCRSYAGNISTTVGGSSCQQWTSNYPQAHGSITPGLYPGELANSSEYCRNPGGRGRTPWCFTTDIKKRWEYCNIPECATPSTSSPVPMATCQRYSGTRCAAVEGYSNTTVYVNSTTTQLSLETLLNTTWDNITLTTTPGCGHLILSLLCYTLLPPCTPDLMKPRLLCQGQCGLKSVPSECLRAVGVKGVKGVDMLLEVLDRVMNCSSNIASEDKCLSVPPLKSAESAQGTDSWLLPVILTVIVTIMITIGVITTIIAVKKFKAYKEKNLKKSVLSQKMSTLQTQPPSTLPACPQERTEPICNLNTSYYLPAPAVPQGLQGTFDRLPRIKRLDLNYVGRLRSGISADVSKAKMTDEAGGSTMVAMKILKTDVAAMLELFINEAAMLVTYDHPNVLKLIGVSVDITPYVLVTEYMDLGNLSSFLQDLAGGLASSPEVAGCHLTPQELTSICLQVAMGMEHVASHGHIHCDLAARNCLVRSPLVVKVGDFGMCRSLGMSMEAMGSIPIRWMSPESLRTKLFTPAGDVWSYGVVVWEVFSRGAIPYHEYNNREARQRVMEGHCLEYPHDCPPDIQDVLHRCWAPNPAKRPKFGDIVKLLSSS